MGKLALLPCLLISPQVSMAALHRDWLRMGSGVSWALTTPDESDAPEIQDNMWPIITSLILTPVANEFKVGRPPLLTLAQNIGLLAGAAFWGFGSDIFGRRWGFNLTLGITGLFGMLAASSPNFAAAGCFAAL